jgi:hypothetical protein
MPPSNTKPAGLRKKQYGLIYQLDFLDLNIIIRADIIIQDGKSNILTPVTPAYEKQLVTEHVTAIPKITNPFNRDDPLQPITRNSSQETERLTPRHHECCFVNSEGGETIRTVYNPYSPKNSDFLKLIKELLDYNNIGSVNYFGESINSEVSLWL